MPPSTLEVAAYFDRLYAALAASPAFEAAGQEVYGDAFFGQLGYATADDVARLAELAEIRSGAYVIDLCCGLGGLGPYLSRLTGADVVGLDCASPRYGPGVRGDAGALPFRGAGFDAAVCLDGFSYDSGRLFGEAARVMKAGARFAFLLSLSVPEIDPTLSALLGAGLLSAHTEDVTSGALATLKRLGAAYSRRETQLRREIGAKVYRGLVSEIAALIAGLKSGRLARVLVFGQR